MMDEFGSVLAMAALILGICAAADWLFLVVATDSTRPDRADAESSHPKFMAVVHRDRVVLADHGPARQVTAAPDPDAGSGAQVAPAAPMPLAQQARLSW